MTRDWKGLCPAVDCSGLMMMNIGIDSEKRLCIYYGMISSVIINNFTKVYFVNIYDNTKICLITISVHTLDLTTQSLFIVIANKTRPLNIVMSIQKCEMLAFVNGNKIMNQIGQYT
jgi:hypothetical protein